MNNLILNSFTNLRTYCEKEDFKGWDPYDGLNSKVFQTIPFLKRSALMRLVVIQGFKWCPINLRKIAFVPKGYNAKGIALFLSGYCNLYKVIDKGIDVQISKEACLNKINYLAELLISLQSKGYSGACWGYNFDWQSRAFFLPKYTPTVVATSFVVESLLSAYDITKNEEYKNIAVSSANFILKDLTRIDKGQGFMFSYSPLDNRAVYNASLLGSKTLSLIYHYTNIEEYKQTALITIDAACKLQNNDGSFPHSDQIGDKWRDSFHTGFKLESIAYYQKYCNDNSYSGNIENGFKYLIENYFDKETGVAFYYDRKMEGAIDLHCASQFMATLYKLEKFKENNTLSTKVLQWAIDNMQNKENGSFYFQMKNKRKNKIIYSRWPNAWMFYGISYYLLNRDE